MCELIVKAIDTTHPDPEKDRRGCYKRGYICGVYPDGTKWGAQERLPKFVILKFPGVPVDNLVVQKYLQPQLDDIPGTEVGLNKYRRRLWQIQWDSLPVTAKNKLASTGELIIKVGSYSGEYDYTWTQVKSYFKNLKTNAVETEGI
jgi:hypothetical protein